MSDSSFDSLLDDESFESKVDREGKFRLNSKSFFLTYPRCELEPKLFFELLSKVVEKHGRKVQVCVSSSEDHKTTEGKHIHSYFVLDKKIDVSSQTYFDISYGNCVYHPNIQKPRNKVFVLKYIVGLTKKKIDDPKNIYEFGIDVKKFLSSKKNHRRCIFKQLINKDISILDAVNEDPSLISCYKTLKNNLILYWSDVSIKKFKNKRLCFWIFGKPGVGKSYSVRKMFPDLYLKDNTKWWDGYIDQDCVLIDDFDSKEFYHYLKIWSDDYVFNAEVKGGTVECKYHLLFVTSNYTIYDIFFDTKDIRTVSLIEALNRRFIVVDVSVSLNKDGFFFFSDEIVKKISNFCNEINV